MRNAQTQTAANELIRAIDEEVADDRRKHSRLDADLLVSRKQELLKSIAQAAAAAKREHQTELEAHHIAVEHGIARALEISEQAPTAIHRQRRYSNACREATRRGHAISSDVRTRYSRRLGTSALADGVRNDIGVGSVFIPDSPTDTRRWMVRQTAALEAPDNQALFKKRGLRPAAALAELRPALQTLSKELDEGVGPAPKQGELSAELTHALVWLEVAVERTVMLLQDLKMRAAAEKIEADLPLRVVLRRRGEREEEDGEDGAEGADAEAKEGAGKKGKKGATKKGATKKDAGAKGGERKDEAGGESAGAPAEGDVGGEEGK